MQLFVRYEYSAQGRPRFGVSLGLFVDCLNTFSVPGHSSTIEIQYPGPDMQLLLKYAFIAFFHLLSSLDCLCLLLETFSMQNELDVLG